MSASDDTRRDADPQSMARGRFFKTSAVGSPVRLAQCWARQRSCQVRWPNRHKRPRTEGRMKIGINLEYVRHADKSLAYGIKTAGEIGYLGRAVLPDGSLPAVQRRLLPCDQPGHGSRRRFRTLCAGRCEDQRAVLALGPDESRMGRALRSTRHSLCPGAGRECRADHRGHVSTEVDDRTGRLRDHEDQPAAPSPRPARKTASTWASSSTDRTPPRSSR